MPEIVQNLVKQRLTEGKIAFGLTIRFTRMIEIARMAATSGYHYLYIDLQHNTMDVDTAAHMCAAALDAGVTPIVRVPSHLSPYAGRLLDGGAQGISYPDVANAEHARQLVRQCKFAPVGERSMVGMSIQLGWKDMPARESTKILNDNTLLIAIIESAEGLDNIEEIAAVEGIDVITVGTNDLTSSLGIPGEYDHPRLLEAYRHIAETARRHGKFLRLGGVADPRLVRRTIEYGSRLIAVDNDTRLLLKAMRGGLAELAGQLDAALL